MMFNNNYAEPFKQEKGWMGLKQSGDQLNPIAQVSSSTTQVSY